MNTEIHWYSLCAFPNLTFGHRPEECSSLLDISYAVDTIIKLCVKDMPTLG